MRVKTLEEAVMIQQRDRVLEYKINRFMHHKAQEFPELDLLHERDARQGGFKRLNKCLSIDVLTIKGAY